MKMTQEVIGLPIISISDGMEVGKVKSVIINADKGAIDYIVVDGGVHILGVRVIPTESVLGIGEYALTIEDDSVISDISKIPAAIDLLQKNIQVKGTKVLTKKGRLIGQIGDIYVDEDECCKITGLEYIADITQKAVRIIPRESVITFGKNLLVVIEEVEGTLLDEAAQLGQGAKPAEDEKKNLTNSEVAQFEITLEDQSGPDAGIGMNISEGSSITANGIEPNTDSVQANDEAVDSINRQNTAPASSEDNTANLFEQRQRQYLIGRKATKTISDSAGNVIISEGMTITNDIIDAAKLHGKLIELVMNNKA